MNRKTEKKLDKLLDNTLDLALKRRAKWLIENLNPQDGDKILDVGCGDGYYLFLLSNLGLDLELVGIDNDVNALKPARQNIKGRKVKLLYGDLMKRLPLKSNSFDKIVMSEVLEHLPNDFKGLSEVRRVLKPDGVIAISVPNYNFPFLWDPLNWVLQYIFKTHIKSGFWAGIWSQHIRLYRPKEIKKVTEKAGFKIKKVYIQTFWSIPFNHNLINLGARILTKNSSKTLFSGVNKFKIEEKKSFIAYLYFYLTNFVDKLNEIWMPEDIGVSIVVIAKRA